MALGTNRWKLGLFVILGSGVALAALIIFGARRWNERTVSYFTYFDESVQGLDPGSPVKFRGVTVGRVASIEVAPDHRHVQVSLELSSEQLERLNLGSLRRSDPAIATSKLRVQLSQTGITGVKFILLDFFDGSTGPPLTLPFPTPRNTIPSTPSTMKNLEDAVVRAAGHIPEIMGAVLGTMTKMNDLLDSVAAERLPERASKTLAAADATMGELRGQVRDLNAGELSVQAKKDLVELERTLQSAERVISRLDSEKGLVQSVERVANSVGEVARGAHAVGPELELTLREVRGAARSIRHFADTLERDPDMLLKGRAVAAP
jgi:ABC-type transporter Mla subunit MlaD